MGLSSASPEGNNPQTDGVPRTGLTVLVAREMTPQGVAARRRVWERYEPLVRRFYLAKLRAEPDYGRAEDLTQNFLIRLCGDRATARKPCEPAVCRYDPVRGSFRAWVLTLAFKFLCDDARSRAAAMRGGGRRREPLHDGFPGPGDDERESDEVAPLDVEQFDRAWAMRILGLALDQPQVAEKFPWVPQIGLILGPGSGSPRERLARLQGTNANNAGVLLHRFRNSLRPPLRELIAEEEPVAERLDLFVDFVFYKTGLLKSLPGAGLDL